MMRIFRKKIQPEEKARSSLEELYIGEIVLSSEHRDYPIVQLADHILIKISDDGLGAILREVENNDVAMCLKGVSGVARKHVISMFS